MSKSAPGYKKDEDNILVELNFVAGQLGTGDNWNEFQGEDVHRLLDEFTGNEEYAYRHRKKRHNEKIKETSKLYMQYLL